MLLPELDDELPLGSGMVPPPGDGAGLPPLAMMLRAVWWAAIVDRPAEDVVARPSGAVACRSGASRKPGGAGRGDGEDYQIGLVDICDTPYWETIGACREIGRTMYRRRADAKFQTE